MQNTNFQSKSYKIAIVGLGYVGLPLAVEFAKKFQVKGFDINLNRISMLNQNKDVTLEVTENELINVKLNNQADKDKGLIFTNNYEEIEDCDIYIITVPTPIDKYNKPDLTPIYRASETVGKLLKKGNFVIYESTVYPGVTEDECIPILEKESDLILNTDFYVGYSPERINPGDKEHTVSKILKITSGSNEYASIFIDLLYREIIKAGTFRATSIKVAEAAKVIENTQRDINIAFVNELSKIFNLLELDTNDVLEAAGTKWNFLKFKPGLVGGHCIGVDPYYLAQKAQELGYHPEMILAGRRINDSMGQFIVQETIKKMVNKNLNIPLSKILILGFTFKENCPDVRNSKVIDIYNELKTYNVFIDIYDPHANKEDVKKEFGINIETTLLPDLKIYSAIILAVAHDEFLKLPIQVNNACVVYDVKGVLEKSKIDARL